MRSVELMRSYSSNKAGVMPVAGRVGVGSDLRCLQFCGCEFMLQGFFSFLLVFLPPGCCCFTVGCTHAIVLALMQCHLG